MPAGARGPLAAEDAGFVARVDEAFHDLAAEGTGPTCHEHVHDGGIIGLLRDRP